MEEGDDGRSFFQVEGGISKQALLDIYAKVLDGTFKVFCPFGLPGLLCRYCPKAIFLDRYSGPFEQVRKAQRTCYMMMMMISYH